MLSAWTQKHMKSNQKSNKLKQTKLTSFLFKENICSLRVEWKCQLKTNPTKAEVVNINPTVGLYFNNRTCNIQS